jgi:hypothetical protein
MGFTGTGGLDLAPLAEGELVTCVLRAATPQDLMAAGAFVIPASGVPEAPGVFRHTMHLCVSTCVAAPDEIRSYCTWRRSKGGSR